MTPVRLTDVAELKGWLPVDAEVIDGKPGLRWMDFSGAELAEPFFQQTIARLRSSSSKRRERFCEFDISLQQPIAECLTPDGFIFHSSRCGSTLVANACRILDESIVVSEAPALDKLLTRFITDAQNDRVKELVYSLILRSIVNALGQKRSGHEQHFFIKLSCCSTLVLDHMLRIWPQVPCLFIYRDPVETLVSNIRTLPEWTHDCSANFWSSVLNIEPDMVRTLEQEEFCARALGMFYAKALENLNDRLMLINYEQLSVSTMIKVLRFFGKSLNATQLDQLNHVMAMYSKDENALEEFKSDTAVKRSLTSTAVVEAASLWASDLYQKLEARRWSQSLNSFELT